jgi:serine/threonine protein kinase
MSLIDLFLASELSNAQNSGQIMMAPLSPETIDAFSVISEYDPSSGVVNDTFFTIPPEYARANASCVNIANTIFIIGGVNLTSGKGIRTIDAVDIMNLEFIPNVAEIDAALSNPSVSTDFTSIYIAGGRELKEDRKREHGSGVDSVAFDVPSSDLNRMVWRFVPQIGGDDTTPTCVELLPILPANFGTTSNFSNFETQLNIAPFAGFIVVVDALTANAAILQIHFPATTHEWLLIAWPARNDTPSMPNSTTPSPQESDPPTTPPIPQNVTISPFPVGAGLGMIATCLTKPNTTTMTAISNHSNSPCPAGSSLILFRFGGLVMQQQWLTYNTSIVTTIVSTNISASESMGLLTLPATTLKEYVISSGLFSFGMTGGNTTNVCNGSIRTTPCKVRLSSRLDCLGNAAGTFDAPWDGTHDVVFTATGASFPVYVCFSFGVDKSDTCNKQEVRSTFYNTDALNPLSLLNGPITPAPTYAPSTAPSPPSSSLATLLYILGAVAVVTTFVAVLLVAKLRRVPDEGLLGGQSAMPTVGYGTHQEERYKILGKIGEGAFSVVYLVARRADNVRFAMKYMECQSDIQRQEAIKECEIMRSLQGHPNVINLYDMFMNYEFDAAEPPNDEATALMVASERKTKRSRHLCLVMEYHGAGDLRRWALNHKGNPSETILCSIAFQVTSVLKHIHAQDPPVIHRDLKPENVLIVSLDEDGSSTDRNNNNTSVASPLLALEATHSSKINFLPIVITDFGLARIQEGDYCASGAGTLPYVAPECFRKKYTTQCDMWSLGCVLYAIATKRCSHDTVRLMFQDCERPGFRESITEDLMALGLTKTFIAYVLMLVEPDMKLRVTADQGFKMFRKKDGSVFLSSRAVEEKSKLIATTLQRREDDAAVAAAITAAAAAAAASITEPLLREDEGASVQGSQLPESEASIHSETRAEEL